MLLITKTVPRSHLVLEPPLERDSPEEYPPPLEREPPDEYPPGAAIEGEELFAEGRRGSDDDGGNDQHGRRHQQDDLGAQGQKARSLLPGDPGKRGLLPSREIESVLQGLRYRVYDDGDDQHRDQHTFAFTQH